LQKEPTAVIYRLLMTEKKLLFADGLTVAEITAA
jgi:hypothetical protein